MKLKQKITVIGAGLVGSFLALRLGQLGFEVEVYERRPDPRTMGVIGGRSINLALSNRGIRALELVGMHDIVQDHAIRMGGRLIHDKLGNLRYLPYSGRKGDYINSIGRGNLNALLLDKADEYPNVQINFNKKCTSVDLQNDLFFIKDENSSLIKSLPFETIIGTDGADSTLRKSIQTKLGEDVMQIETSFLEHGYKELTIPPTIEGEFALETNVLHIWPRGDFMMIALPNLDKSFTVTLFLSKSLGTVNFEQLNDSSSVRSFFEEHFPDVVQYMPGYVHQYFENPVGILATTKCNKWSYKEKALLLGDAAHPIVPFYGQGMNAGFEDCRILSALIEKYDGINDGLLRTFEELRMPHTNAIADLAIDNFYEMRDHVNNIAFVKKSGIEYNLEQSFQDYFSKYSMVTFRDDLSYLDAMNKGRAQDEWLLEYCKHIGNINEVDLIELKASLYDAMAKV